MKKILVVLALAFLIIGCQKEEVNYEDFIDRESGELYAEEGGGKVTLVDFPSYLATNVEIEFAWQAFGGTTIEETYIEASSTSDFSDSSISPVRSGAPGSFKSVLVFDSTGTYHIRAYALIGGEDFYSETVAKNVW